ncbi:MAG TPA: hypothetical protein VEC18_09655 [Myxococcota bacterium]|nr:hypothetical protein [Myxococcota bacterium]
MRADKALRWARCAISVAAALGSVSALGAEPPAGRAQPERIADLPQLDPSDTTHVHRVVLITADSLSPASIELEPGQLVAWISYAPGPSTVVFEREVARSMVCHKRVNFEFERGELRSAPIEAGEFASFCELAPGRYRYRVERSAPSEAARAEAPEPLAGEIVVGSE